MALKKTALGHAVYVTATDPNSKRDIAAFCQHAGYTWYSRHQSHRLKIQQTQSFTRS
ncbi:MAG: hypothetical protein U1E92_06135 [Moraxella osloensis]